jgi:hypothetical protein
MTHVKAETLLPRLTKLWFGNRWVWNGTCVAFPPIPLSVTNCNGAVQYVAETPKLRSGRAGQGRQRGGGQRGGSNKLIITHQEILSGAPRDCPNNALIYEPLWHLLLSSAHL